MLVFALVFERAEEQSDFRGRQRSSAQEITGKREFHRVATGLIMTFCSISRSLHTAANSVRKTALLNIFLDSVTNYKAAYQNNVRVSE